MAQYQSTSRRQIAQMFRRTAGGATNLCVRLGVPANAISYSSILVALIASLCFWKSGENAWLLIIAPLFCYLRLWFNMLDGMVAVAAGKASARGEIVNDLPARSRLVLRHSLHLRKIEAPCPTNLGCDRSKLRCWTSSLITTPSLHESRHDHRSRSSWTHFRFLRVQCIPAFPSDAAASARCGW